MGSGLVFHLPLCPHILGHFGGDGGCAPLLLFQAPEHEGRKVSPVEKFRLGHGGVMDLRRSSRLNSMCQTLHSWTDCSPEWGRAHDSESTGLELGAGVPDSFLGSVATKSWQSGLSSALIELWELPTLRNPLKK